MSFVFDFALVETALTPNVVVVAQKLIKELPSIVHDDTEANSSGEATSSSIAYAGGAGTLPQITSQQYGLLSEFKDKNVTKEESTSATVCCTQAVSSAPAVAAADMVLLSDIKDKDGPSKQQECTTTPTSGTGPDHGEPASASAMMTAEASNEDDSSEEHNMHGSGGDGPRTAVTAQDFRKNPGEIAFFKMLRSEFGKATRFFDMAQREYTIREERVREGMDIVKTPNGIMVNEKWSALAKSIYRLYKDLLLLETYAIMTYCSFSKILKKHDKVTGCVTRVAFMSNVVAKANFTNYPEVLEMIRRCEKMYEEVSDHLVREGKTGLLEDERLFINMISRLNAQALETPDAPIQQEGTSRRSPPCATASIAAVPGKPESFEMMRLRSIVESNDAASVSEDIEEDRAAIDGYKRKRAASAKEPSKRQQR
jgi:hypothetical protein